MGLFSRHKPAIDPDSEHRDWELVSTIAQDALKEQRRARRWGIFFKLLTFFYITVVLVGVALERQQAGGSFSPKASHTAVVTVYGAIADEEKANANAIVGGLRKAFQNEASAAVMVVINSPGGSPVQSGYVYDEIRRKDPSTRGPKPAFGTPSPAA